MPVALRREGQRRVDSGHIRRPIAPFRRKNGTGTWRSLLWAGVSRTGLTGARAHVRWQDALQQLALFKR